MMTVKSGYQRVTFARAAELCRYVKLGPEASALLGPEAAPREFVDRLVAGQHRTEALQLLAHALPPREAVWWGAVSLWLATGSQASRLAAEQRAALRGAVLWVVEPSESNRRAAESLSKPAGGSAAGALALAAFYSGGSIAPPHLPPVAAKPFVTARAVAGALLMAAVFNGGPKRPGYQQRFIELGTQVADGQFLWDDPAIVAAVKP